MQKNKSHFQFMGYQHKNYLHNGANNLRDTRYCTKKEFCDTPNHEAILDDS